MAEFDRWKYKKRQQIITYLIIGIVCAILSYVIGAFL